ncbi:bardet-biedl syndrome parathyroid hormone-responsive b1 [Plasmopara halstedii]|uniref:Bardet-biedl syndrome parathyroid hormone-responsive b1 n=1 Tax=Plasmopara halstedii TaxID=4781 RepID=A0A0P1ATT4_PLAHL|nr:bardet-biedl syndrome parathyroid hormone-responsive b1 [Plasmopara halstedii]CEG45305.1 bardet-biedl syndrome parathyroid hormone-responsive b1 [Plasmopara halstedii]|eukprot:XP_024581674.1 bardet-biedl syndrome parathyroid hormone-responsive b1 [Plasmopara halstedii]
MSLFQVREWWRVKGEEDEEYTFGGLVLGNVDNDPSGHVKIVTGSLNGMLRMYCPTERDFRIEHLLLEENLRRPILQLALGSFIPNQRILALAILHPRRIGVYVVEGIGGNGMAANYFKLVLRYEHLLGVDGKHFTAFNFIYGPFGTQSSSLMEKTIPRDHLCVQSLDGRLQFFEQDRFSFLQSLNNNFLPGAIIYASKLDAIIASTSDFHVECYRYQALASASLKKHSNVLNEETQEDRKIATFVHCEWKLNLGETILDIQVTKTSNEDSNPSFEILVLGEFTLFGIKSQGEIYLQKRLGFSPSVFLLYQQDLSIQSLENLLIASHSKIWNVYQDKTLIWSACASTVPVALGVGAFGGLNGMIVSLDADGALRVNYMGTDPPSTAVVAPDTKEINYEEMDEEHRQLLGVIRRAQGERRIEPKDRVLIRAQIPTILENLSDRNEKFNYNGNQSSNLLGISTQLTMRIYLTYTGTTFVSNVTLSISTPENIVAMKSSYNIERIDGKTSTPLCISVILHPNVEIMPSSLDLIIAASYTLETGQPRVSQYHVKLPFCLLCRVVPPVKSCNYKFTLETNQEPLELVKLFDEMLHQPNCTPEWTSQLLIGNSGTNVLSFQYYNGIDVTILVSKNAGRYRIQSNELEALWMISSELVARLERYFDTRNVRMKESVETLIPLEIYYQEPLPLADFFGIIDVHFNLRKEKLELIAQLNDRAHQYRVIEKRLLVRYKDRNPPVVQYLDVLLHGTYDQLLALSHEMDTVEIKLQRAANRLACCVSLILLLIKLRFHLSDEDAEVLEAYLSPIINDSNLVEQGWEERTDSAMTELLRTLLAKQPPNKELNPVVLTTELSIQDDTKRLKKHITIVCDRLGKGAKLVSSKTNETKE